MNYYLFVGRYFACSTHTLALTVHSKKVNTDGSRAYFVTDGSYSSFQFLKNFKLHIHPDVLKVCSIIVFIILVEYGIS